MERTNDPIIDLVDAHAGAVHPADVVFVFGTQHWSPAELAASLYFDGMAPKIILTGGPSRHPRGRAEARVHRDLLIAAGVPESAVLVEETSRHTGENVSHAAPLLNRIGPVTSAIAVVKWFHRRALITLAAQVPSLERIYAADYEPFNANTRSSLARATWETSCPKSVAKEERYLQAMLDEQVDLLTRTDDGWIRSCADPQRAREASSPDVARLPIP